MSRGESALQLELTLGSGSRLAGERHHLADPSTEPVEITAGLGGVQAQVALASHHVLSIRSTSLPDLDALVWDERRLVKTWAMRGTLHLLPSPEHALWTSALRRRKWKYTPAWEKCHGITVAQLSAITKAIPRVRSDVPMTRDELSEAIIGEVGDDTLAQPLKSGWSAVLKPAANQGLLIQGPPQGRHVTFVDPGA